MEVPVVKSPLSIIALFVSVIEAFLAYPVTKLTGQERLIMVIFMVTFPFFVSASFFVILWFKPLHLYNPGEIPHDLQDRYQSAASEARLDDLEDRVRRLATSAIPAGTALITPAATSELSAKAEQTLRSDDQAVEAEVREKLRSSKKGGAVTTQDVKQEIQQTRRKTKQARAKQAREEMEKFRDWLHSRGFADLPAVPWITIDPPDVFNAYYLPKEKTAHFGELISEDIGTVAHTYFHVVLNAIGPLGKADFVGDAAALIEGFCDYFACSYMNDPHMGELFAKASQLGKPWIRNLEEVARWTPGEEPHALSVAWSGACWELRGTFGGETIDGALRDILPRLPSDSDMVGAGQALRDELGKIRSRDSIVVEACFSKRGIELQPAKESARPHTHHA